jgi:hypothetical protein
MFLGVLEVFGLKCPANKLAQGFRSRGDRFLTSPPIVHAVDQWLLNQRVDCEAPFPVQHRYAHCDVSML